MAHNPHSPTSRLTGERTHSHTTVTVRILLQRCSACGSSGARAKHRRTAENRCFSRDRNTWRNRSHSAATHAATRRGTDAMFKLPFFLSGGHRRPQAATGKLRLRRHERALLLPLQYAPQTLQGKPCKFFPHSKTEDTNKERRRTNTTTPLDALSVTGSGSGQGTPAHTHDPVEERQRQVLQSTTPSSTADSFYPTAPQWTERTKGS